MSKHRRVKILREFEDKYIERFFAEVVLNFYVLMIKA